MKRILALLLSVAMLLGACAFAEEAEAVGHSYTLSDIVLTYGENTIDLSYLTFGIDVSPEGDAVLAYVDADGETAAELGFTKLDNLYVAHMAGLLTGHKDFVTDPVVQLEKALQGGIDSVIDMLQSVDTHELAQKIVDFAGQALSAPDATPESTPEPTPEPTEEPEEGAEAAEGNTIEISLSDLSFKGDLAAVLEGCISQVEGAELDGSNGIPAGTYDLTTFYADEETLAEVLNMVYLKGESAGIGDKLLETGISLAISVAAYSADGVEGADISMAVETDEGSSSAHIIGALTTDESGKTGTYTITGESDGTTSGVSFTTFEGEGTSKDFTPASIDLAEAVNLDDMDGEEASSTIIGAFQTLLTDAMVPIVGPLMGVMAEGADMTVTQDFPTDDVPKA